DQDQMVAIVHLVLSLPLTRRDRAQRDREARPSTRSGVYRHRAVDARQRITHERESEPHARRMLMSNVLEAHERLEDAGVVFFGDAGTRIADRAAVFTVFVIDRQRHSPSI